MRSQVSAQKRESGAAGTQPSYGSAYTVSTGASGFLSSVSAGCAAAAASGSATGGPPSSGGTTPVYV